MATPDDPAAANDAPAAPDAATANEARNAMDGGGGAETIDKDVAALPPLAKDASPPRVRVARGAKSERAARPDSGDVRNSGDRPVRRVASFCGLPRTAAANNTAVEMLRAGRGRAATAAQRAVRSMARTRAPNPFSARCVRWLELGRQTLFAPADAKRARNRLRKRKTERASEGWTCEATQQPRRFCLCVMLLSIMLWPSTHQKGEKASERERELELELELELIQTQMAQKPMLRAEVYARALRASQSRESKRAYVWVGARCA